MIRFRDYIYPINHSGKGFIFFYSPSIHALILRAFIIYKQEQTLLFIEFRAYYLISCNLFLKVTNFIIGGSLNSTKMNCFVGVRYFINNYQLYKLIRREY